MSDEMRRCVAAFVFPDVSEEHIAFIFNS